MSLAASSSLKDWQAALASYESVIQQHSQTAKRRAKLEALDEFVRVKIPELVQQRYSNDAVYGYLEKEEICRIVEWKITRGKMRPLMRFANALDPKEAIEATKVAFAMVRKDPKAALERLTALKGIDEAMLAFDIVNKNTGKLDYTVASWEKLKDRCETKAAELNESIAEDSEQEPWTAVMLERAIWAASEGKS